VTTDAPPDVLLVCSAEVLERYRAVNGTELPPWRDFDTVTDEELTAANVVRIVYEAGPGDALDKLDLMNRLRDLEVPNARIFTKDIAALEEHPAKVAAAAESEQEREDRRAERQERARRRAARVVDAEELAELVEARVKQTAREFAKVTPPEPIIDRLLAAEMNLIGGPSESGKSLLARDWALSVATGEPWRGYTVPTRRNVLWVASEGLHDFSERWESQHLWDMAADRVYVLEDPVNLVTGGDVDWLLGEYAEERPGLVVFDIVYAMGMNDDNGTKDVLPLITSLKKISAAWGAATLAIGHTKHGDERRFRGASAWRQLTAVEHHMADGLFSCEKSKISDKRTHAAKYQALYPNLRWMTTAETVAEEAERYVRISEDFRERPKDSDRKRAARLHRELGLSEERARKWIRSHREGMEEGPGE
jgi:hypothetical protein